MTRIHVCPLHLVPAQSAQLQPSALITLLSPAGQVPQRPDDLPHDRHLTRLFHDIAGPAEGLTPPSERDVEAVIAFGRTWDRRSPLLIHCFAGISRSTAAAFIIAADLNPGVPEVVIAERLRAASPSATPNPLMIEIADDLLRRERRMVVAVAGIGVGNFTSHGHPFQLGPDF